MFQLLHRGLISNDRVDNSKQKLYNISKSFVKVGKDQPNILRIKQLYIQEGTGYIVFSQNSFSEPL